MNDVSNFRPISLLPVFSKIFEKVMYKLLDNHLNANNILVPEQFGFRKNISTNNATFRLTDTILNSLNEKLHIGGIFCDVAKAFDCVNHNVLLPKLNYQGVTGIANDWFRSYLSERKQRVLIKSLFFQADWETVTSGVP